MPTSDRHSGPHELGQNFLTDQRIINRITALVDLHAGPIVEWGTGDGALTRNLARLNRPIEGIEIDPLRAHRLDRRLGPHVCITEGDILRHAPPPGAVVVSNVPFHITTQVLRHLLKSSQWEHAVLITQWEVARRRTGVGGATQLTAQWWPWYEFILDQRIPSTAFTPRPSVDAGLFSIHRREKPLLPTRDKQRYQAWVTQVFQGRGRNLVEILRRTGVPHDVAKRLNRHLATRRTPLPRDLTAEAWATAYRAREVSRPPRPRRNRP